MGCQFFYFNFAGFTDFELLTRKDERSESKFNLVILKTGFGN